MPTDAKVVYSQRINNSSTHIGVDTGHHSSTVLESDSDYIHTMGHHMNDDLIIRLPQD